MDSNEDDVLEDDNETASIKKDAEIEKLKGVVINLTGESEKYKKQIADMTEKSKSDPVKVDFYVAMYNKFKRGLLYVYWIRLREYKVKAHSLLTKNDSFCPL